MVALFVAYFAVVLYNGTYIHSKLRWHIRKIPLISGRFDGAVIEIIEVEHMGTEHFESRRMPMLALRGLVVFPGMTLHFDVGRKKSMAALKVAMDQDQDIFLVTQKDIEVDEPKTEELYPIGVISTVKQILRLPNSENVRVVVEGRERAFAMEVNEEEGYPTGLICPCYDTAAAGKLRKMKDGYIRKVKEQFEEYATLANRLPPDMVLHVYAMEEPGALADYIASNIMLDYTVKQDILSQMDPLKRLELLCVTLEKEINILTIEGEIQEKVQDLMDKNQREYYLREEMKVIADELGEGDSPQTESETYRARIMKAAMPQEAQEKLLGECDKLFKMPSGSHEANVLRGYLDACLELPWEKETKDTLDLKKAQRLLDREHFGLAKVKERIIEMLAVRQLAPQISGQILCLVGPPGVGKTSIVRSLAKAMNRKYARLSLGGIKDEAEIRGHRKTYVGAMPGRIMNAMKQAGTRNPLILLDEVDKLGADYKGDPSSALLEVLDPEQNSTFRDHYIELPYDLSRVLFITTANTTSTIPEPLLDRMEIIELSSYTHEEKFHIAKKHLLKKQMERHGLDAKRMRVREEALHQLIEFYTKEAGVRRLEQMLATLCRKAAKAVVDGETDVFVVTPQGLEGLLGPKRFQPDEMLPQNEVGIVTGLAWTSVGGTTLPVEVAVLDGNGKLELTGSLGDVMKESARAAISFIRSRADHLNIPRDFYQTKDIHIHVPEGAIPKDGPSAGITIATALISQLTGIPANREVAMTGEITLKGRVLPIGGLKEKTMAAYRMGIKKIIIPYDNRPDLSEIDKAVLEHVEFFTAKSLDDVLPVALVMPKEEKKPLGKVKVPLAAAGAETNVIAQ